MPPSHAFPNESPPVPKKEPPEWRGSSVPAVLNAKSGVNRGKPGVSRSAPKAPPPASKQPAAATAVRPRRAASHAPPPPPPPCRLRANTAGPAPQRTALADRGGGRPRIIRTAEGAILEAWPVGERPDAPVLGDEPVRLSDGRIKPRTKREADEQLELQWQKRRRMIVQAKVFDRLEKSVYGAPKPDKDGCFVFDGEPLPQWLNAEREMQDDGRPGTYIVKPSKQDFEQRWTEIVDIMEPFGTRLGIVKCKIPDGCLGKPVPYGEFRAAAAAAGKMPAPPPPSAAAKRRLGRPRKSETPVPPPPAATAIPEATRPSPCPHKSASVSVTALPRPAPSSPPPPSSPPSSPLPPPPPPPPPQSSSSPSSSSSPPPSPPPSPCPPDLMVYTMSQFLPLHTNSRHPHAPIYEVISKNKTMVPVTAFPHGMTADSHNHRIPEETMLRRGRSWYDMVCDNPGGEVHYSSDNESTAALRAYLGLDDLRLERLAGNRMFDSSQKVVGIHTPYLYLGNPYTLFALHQEDYCALSLNYHHRGAPKMWRVTCPLDFDKVEELVRRAEDLLPGEKLCSQHVRHASVFLSRGALELAGVRSILVRQQQGEMIITWPLSYHQGWNEGANVCEAIAYGSAAWRATFVGRDGAHVYRACGHRCVARGMGLPIELQFD